MQPRMRENLWSCFSKEGIMSTKAMTISAAVLVFLLALGLTLYPLISNQYNQQHQSQIHKYLTVSFLFVIRHIDHSPSLVSR